MTTEDAKTYLSKRDIPRLFESLMTGLMYHRPQDHIKYLIDCLQKVHDKGQENITWSSFVDIRRTKTPLPPISNGTARPTSKGSSRPSSKTKPPAVEDSLLWDMGNIDEPINSREIVHDRVNSPIHTSNNRKPSVNATQNNECSEKSPQRNSYSQEEKVPREKTSSPLPAIPTSTSTAASTEKVNLPDIPIIMVIGAPGSGKDAQVERLLKRYPNFKHLNVGKLIKEEITRRGDAHSKWKLTGDLLSRGEAAPQEVTIDVLIEGLKKVASSAKGVIITGYPRSMDQVEDYTKFVSRVDVVFIIDCDESKAMDKMLRKGRTSNKPEHSMSAVTNRMNHFKAHTLPAAKYYDDLGKLVVIEGDTDEDSVQYKFGAKFDELFFKKYGTHKQDSTPPKSAGSSNLPEPATYSKKSYDKEDSTLEEDEKPLFTGAVPLPPVISESDTGRKPDLPQCPIIFVSGGPGSGKGTQCSRITQRYPDFVHISMGDVIRTEISDKGTADDKWSMISTLVSKGEMAPEEVTVDLLKGQLKKHSSAKAFLIEGFPRDKAQVEAFNKNIGGLNFVILFDCEEYYMQTRLLKRGRDSGRIDDNPTAIANRLNFYKYNTLPVMKYFDEAGKLVVLDADRDMESMFYDISQMFDFAFFGKKPGDERGRKSSEDKKINAALQIKAGVQGCRARSSKESPKTPKTDDDKLKAQVASMTYMTEVKANKLDNDAAMAALRIKAGFEGGKRRQRKILRSRASYSSKHDSDRLSEKSDVSANTAQAANQIMSAFFGYKQRSSKDDQKQPSARKSSDKPVEKTGGQGHAKTLAANQISAGFAGYKQRLNKQGEKTNAPDKAGHTGKGAHDEKAKAGNQIAAALKGMKTRHKHKKPNEEKTYSEEEQTLAAERIQAGFKGYQTRRQIQAKKEQKQPKQDGSKAQEEHDAAERIQAGFRGYQTRKQFTEGKEEGKKDTEAPAQEAIVEETITQETAQTTGDNVENPSHTQKLDEAAKS